MLLQFAKYHALRNDFILIETTSPGIDKRKFGKLAAVLCNRKSGVGADGLIVLSRSKIAEARFDIFNANGGWAEKSGNGLRVAGLHLTRGQERKSRIAIETAVGVDFVTVGRTGKLGTWVSAEIDGPNFDTKSFGMKSRSRHFINSHLRAGGRRVNATCLSVGNPHCVVLCYSFDFDWDTLGEAISNHLVFERGMNVEFVVVHSPRHIELREWERGVGPTESSGTGAAAAVCACVILGQTERKCKVQFEPGSLNVHWKSETQRIILEGPVTFIATGEAHY